MFILCIFCKQYNIIRNMHTIQALLGFAGVCVDVSIMFKVNSMAPDNDTYVPVPEVDIGKLKTRSKDVYDLIITKQHKQLTCTYYKLYIDCAPYEAIDLHYWPRVRISFCLGTWTSNCCAVAIFSYDLWNNWSYRMIVTKPMLSITLYHFWPQIPRRHTTRSHLWP